MLHSILKVIFIGKYDVVCIDTYTRWLSESHFKYCVASYLCPSKSWLIYFGHAVDIQLWGLDHLAHV